MPKLTIMVGSSNQGKIKEIKQIFEEYKIQIPDIFKTLDIEETGKTFEENALLKAKAFYKALNTQQDNLVVLADDSGLCVDMLGGEPGIYSARYAQIDTQVQKNATDAQNIEYLLKKLKEKSIKTSQAKFVSAIALVGKIQGEFIQTISKGELLGTIINTPRGENGFGYDSLFIPAGYEKTLGELQSWQKNEISHRKNALIETKKFLETKYC